MLNIAIVDDESKERERVKECLAYLSGKENVEFSIREFFSADSFLVNYEPVYDIIFMDIEFPKGDNGMEAARKLRKIDNDVILIFVTNMAQMALQGYDVEALDFIVKPIEKFAFALKVMRAVRRVAPKRENQVSITVDGNSVFLRTSLIQYLEVQGHYIIYHSQEGTYREYSSLATAEKRINDKAFVRSNRGNLVNLRFVKVLKKDTCVVGDAELAIARPQKNAFKKAFADYLDGSMNRGEKK